MLWELLQQNKFKEAEFTTAEHRALEQDRVKGLIITLLGAAGNEGKSFLLSLQHLCVTFTTPS